MGLLGPYYGKKGFQVKQRKWVYGCISIAHFSILINGTPKAFFAATRGLRQRDPLSPFLFTSMGDSFCQVINKGVSRGLIRGSIGSQRLMLSHFQYADDTLILIINSRASLTNLKMIMRCFKMPSGLAVNLEIICLIVWG